MLLGAVGRAMGRRGWKVEYACILYSRMVRAILGPRTTGKELKLSWFRGVWLVGPAKLRVGHVHLTRNEAVPLGNTNGCYTWLVTAAVASRS